MKKTLYFETNEEVIQYFPDGVPSGVIAIVGEGSNVYVSSDNAGAKQSQEYYNADLTNDEIVEQQVTQATSAGYTTGYAEGESAGHLSGYSEGYERGNSDGYEAGSSDGYANGFTLGRIEGHTAGYEEGYAAGLEAGSEDDFVLHPLTITSLEDSNKIRITIDRSDGPENTPINCKYSTDNGLTWINKSLSLSVSGSTYTTQTFDIVTLNANQSVMIKTDKAYFKYLYKSTYGSPSTREGNIIIKATKTFNVSGDTCSLLNYGEIDSLTDYNKAFYHLFYNSTNLISAENLVVSLGNNKLMSNSCCEAMFYGCTSLTTAPSLPATTLASGCYESMFLGCTSLTAAPALPATTLAYHCYFKMFYGCTSLTTAPSLPATTLAESCYDSMFYGCTSLTTAPALPATTLQYYCYSSMFNGCTSLNSATCLATDVSASGALGNWLNNVASTGTFYKNPDATWAVAGTNGIPEGWTVVDYVAA